MATPGLSDGQLAIIATQTTATAAATAASLLLARKQAAWAREQATAESVRLRIHAETQAFEIEQAIINKATQLDLTRLGIEVDEFSIEAMERTTAFNVDLALTEAESVGVMADINATNLRKEKRRNQVETGRAIRTVRKGMTKGEAAIVASSAASGLSMNSDSAIVMRNSILVEGKEQIASLLAQQGDLERALNVRILQEDTEGIRARALGQLQGAEISQEGGRNLFQLQQAKTEKETSARSMESEIKNLRTTADTVRTSGLASANAAIIAGAAAAKSASIQGAFGAFDNLVSGMSSGFSSYMTFQNQNFQKSMLQKNIQGIPTSSSDPYNYSRLAAGPQP